ncbi:MAG TPA: hypothetical protein VGM31_11680, partial [Puia sp.]
SPGSLAGEGAAMFLVSDEKEGALARMRGITILHSEDENAVTGQLQEFLNRHIASTRERPDLFLTGENGDIRIRHFYDACEKVLDNTSPGNDITIARYKHMSGEYPTATAFALWIACQVLGGLSLPSHMIKRPGSAAHASFRNVLIYNNYKGRQHSFMWVSGVE